MATKQGAIYVVGTGPGDLGLITVRGLALVREADVVVGDLLGHARLMQEARPEAARYHVGCRTSRSKMSQPEINALLIELAQAGQTVVRLWPGDPFVYGRASQEIAAARQAGLPATLVPGVTSALAAPAYAGVPVTEWEHAVSFAVVSGYESKNPRVRADWQALARIETLVILMPLDHLEEIVARLRAGGRPGHTPALVVQHGTLPHQKQATATLATLAETVEKNQITSPAIVVVGETAKLAPELAWFQSGEDQPLLGRRVLVTRPAHQAGDFMAALRALGAEPVSFPTIEIRPVADSQPLDDAIQGLGAWSRRIEALTKSQVTGKRPETTGRLPLPDKPPYQWLVLTSVNGVAAFWQRLRQAGFDSRALAHLKIAAIGPATAAALEQRSISPDLTPTEYTAEGVLEAFDRLGPVAGQRFLLARSDIARQTLAVGLVERGAEVDEIASYRTVPVEKGAPPPFADIVTFTSSSTVQGYINCLAGRRPAEFLANSRVVCIGPVTAATAETLGVPVSAVADEYTIEGVLLKTKEIDL